MTKRIFKPFTSGHCSKDNNYTHMTSDYSSPTIVVNFVGLNFISKMCIEFITNYYYKFNVDNRLLPKISLLPIINKLNFLFIIYKERYCKIRYNFSFPYKNDYS